MSSKRGPVQPKGAKNASPRTLGSGSGRRSRPPVPPELRQPGITEMKKFCKAAGIIFDYKPLVQGCKNNKERVAKLLDLLIAAGLEGKPTLDKCRALNRAKLVKRKQEILGRKQAGANHNGAPHVTTATTQEQPIKEEARRDVQSQSPARFMTRGATVVEPSQLIVISSDEEDGTPAASYLCSACELYQVRGESSARRITRGATGVIPWRFIVISSDEEDGTPAASVQCSECGGGVKPRAASSPGQRLVMSSDEED